MTAQTPKVAIKSLPAEKKVEVTVDGKPFTTYMWPDTLEKPVLYPITTASGIVVTRGFPPLANERQDHPHHVGLWFNYGDVERLRLLEQLGRHQARAEGEDGVR